MWARLLDITRDGIEAQVGVAVENSGAEGDRGDVALAGGAEAEDYAALVRPEAALVRRGEDAGIEECGGFQRVFVGEIRAEQQAAWLAQLLIGREEMADLLEPLGEDVMKATVTTQKVRKNLVQLGFNGGFIHVHDPGKKADDARIWFGDGDGFHDERGDERPQKHAARVGVDRDGKAADLGFKRHGFVGHASGVALWRVWISARARRYDRVDSAPWLRFARLSWRPSRQPPVPES